MAFLKGSVGSFAAGNMAAGAACAEAMPETVHVPDQKVQSAYGKLNSLGSPENSVDTQLTELEEAIDNLNKQLAELSIKLTPVVKNIAIDSLKEKNISRLYVGGLSSISARVHTSAQNIRSTIDDVVALRNSLDI